MQAKITLRRDSGTMEVRLPVGKDLVVGRGSDCDVVVDEQSVSRRHCTLRFENGLLTVVDLGSAHGLVCEKKRVKRCELGVGGTVRLGMVELRFQQVLLRADEKVAPSNAPATGVPSVGSSAAAPVAPPAAPEPAERHEASEPSDSSEASSESGLESSIAVAEAPDPLLGQTLGGYRLRSLLGSGGAATVYLAEQVQLAREVALKVLRQPEHGASPEALQGFLREARAAAKLADPRLVQVFDFGEDRGRHFLSMELVRGGSLARRLRASGPMPWREVLVVLRDVLGALQIAHKAGLVHRDVKPANVLLLPDGHAKLADLGLVRSIGGAGDRAGTAAFMAPEQLGTDPVDDRADLYALGCTAYAALRGKPPFLGTKKEILRQKQQDDPAPFPKELQVPPALDRLIRDRLLARDRDDRPKDAAEVLDELDRIERLPRGGGSAGPGPRRALARAKQRSWLTGPVVFVFGLLLIGIALILVMKLKQASE
ncbi:MAG: protein kinase [Planctomycetes bacterium]|nr:protein kinase [Planctomycetota bacterium]